MTLWAELARTSNDAGDDIILRQRDDVYEIRFNGLELMSSFHHQSEAVLAERSLRLYGKTASNILIAGLGMGFTLRAALDHLGADTTVTVCELVPEIVAWNHLHMGHLAGHPLRDPRVRVVVDDIQNVLNESNERYDVILMDTDNGPDITVRGSNEAIYTTCGVEAVLNSLTTDGVASFWSATISEVFETRLNALSCQWERRDILLRGGRADAFHHIYFAQANHPLRLDAAHPGVRVTTPA
jgi:spermidine synthase